MTTSDLLAEAGHILYGPSGSGWLGALAAAVNINPRQIRYWLTHPDELSANHGVFDLVEQLLHDREREVAGILRTLEQWRNESR